MSMADMSHFSPMGADCTEETIGGDGYKPSQEFADLNLPELDMNDFEFMSWCADGGWGSVYKYRRKTDGKMVAMKFFGMNGCHVPNLAAIELEFIMDAKLGRC